MHFTFEVGEREKHTVSFHFNQMWGNLKITVDEKPVIRDFRILSLKTVTKYEFPVGDTEPHKVVIEKERKLLLAGYRKQMYRVLIDDRLVQEHEGFKTVQATPTNAAVWPLRSWANMWYGCGVPDLGRRHRSRVL
jgi:hypothetical protein